MRTKIFETDKLTSDVLKKIFNKDCGAIRIPNYYPTDLCNKFTKKLVKHPLIKNFAKAIKVKRLGMPHFDIVDSLTFEQYHNEAIPTIEIIRNMFHPALSPMDKIRLQLDEIWESGANLETLYGKKCFVGVCRILESTDDTTEILPHIDRLVRDSPDSFQAISLIDQLAFNVFMSVSTLGGELNIWLNTPTIANYENEINKTSSYHVIKEALGLPDIVISPQIGDLIIFSTHCYHAVKPIKGPNRVSIGSFVGFRGHSQPLTFWT